MSLQYQMWGSSSLVGDAIAIAVIRIHFAYKSVLFARVSKRKCIPRAVTIVWMHSLICHGDIESLLQIPATENDMP